MISDQFATIRGSFSGTAAKEVVASVIRHHRIQASPGYREAANLVLSELCRSGVSAQIERYPANYQSKFWNSSSFQEWEASSGRLRLVDPADQARTLADFREIKLSLIQRSIPFQGQAQVVLVEDGHRQEDYAGLDVAGKLVLTRGDIDRVRELAVEQRGAAGILFDGMREAPPVRRPFDLPDALQYSSFWWTGLPEETKCFGFVLSPRQGHWLRQLIGRREKEGLPPVTVDIDINARFYDGEIEVVEATIGGQDDSRECVIVASHLCHPQPSANDNATGVAANLEAARTLRHLIDIGELPQPRRDIRFIWMPEMTGSYAYLARHEEEIKGMVAGLNLDMVGEDQSQTGSILILERPPDASASFAPDLLERMREEMFDDAPSLSGLTTLPTFRYATTGFSGGSDHYIFSDPTVGVPMPMLIQWPDKFYHTSADTLDKVDPQSLARSGTLAAAYAYFVANAGEEETKWLAYEMLARFQVSLTRSVQAAVTAGWANQARPQLARLERRLTYQLDRFETALGTLKRLWSGIGPTSDALLAEAECHNDLALSRARSVMESETESDSLQTAASDAWEKKAVNRIPLRNYRGPGISIGGMAPLSTEERQAWEEFVAGRAGAHTIPVLAEYWADGRRSILEIIDLVEIETEVRDAELIVRHFELLQKLDLVTYVDQPKETTK